MISCLQAVFLKFLHSPNIKGLFIHLVVLVYFSNIFTSETMSVTSCLPGVY